MDYTIVGMFSKKAEAKAAYENLVNGIFEEEQIDVSPYKTTGEYKGDDYQIEENTESKGLWARLFGSNSKEHDSYNFVAARTHIITVHTRDKKEAEIAVATLDDCGAVDVNKMEEELNGKIGSIDNATTAEYNIEVLGEDIGMTELEKKDILGNPIRANFEAEVDQYKLDQTNYDFSNQESETSDENLTYNKPQFSDDNDISENELNTEVDEQSETIDILEEEMSVSKKEVETGAISIKSRIIEKPVEEEIRLRKERVYVTRKPVNKIVAGEEAFKPEKIEMTETAEIAVVEKSIRLVEEVSLSKEITQDDQVIKDTVRQTEIDIEGDV